MEAVLKLPKFPVIVEEIRMRLPLSILMLSGCLCVVEKAAFGVPVRAVHGR